MKKLIVATLLLCLCASNAFALSADFIRELNNATPGTFKASLGTLINTAQSDISSNSSDITTNTAAIDTIEAFTSDVSNVEFLTTGDTSFSLSNVAYIRKWTGSKNEGISLGAATNQQIVTFSLAYQGGLSGAFAITPDTASGFQIVTLRKTGDTATLKYINSTLGWVIMGMATSDSGNVIGPGTPFN